MLLLRGISGFIHHGNTQSFRDMYSGEAESWALTLSPPRVSWQRTFPAVFSTSLFSCLPSVSECLQKEKGDREEARGR